MSTAIATAEATCLHASYKVAARRTTAARSDEIAFTRSTTEGPFSLREHGAISIDAEPGLVVRMHTGCLWVPHHEEHCSVGIGAGEQFTVRSSGRLTVLATSGTQAELVWPPRGLH